MSGDKSPLHLELIAMVVVALMSAVTAFSWGHHVGRTSPIGQAQVQPEVLWVGEGQILADGRFAFRIQEPKK